MKVCTFIAREGQKEQQFYFFILFITFNATLLTTFASYLERVSLFSEKLSRKRAQKHNRPHNVQVH